MCFNKPLKAKSIIFPTLCQVSAVSLSFRFSKVTVRLTTFLQIDQAGRVAPAITQSDAAFLIRKRPTQLFIYQTAKTGNFGPLKK